MDTVTVGRIIAVKGRAVTARPDDSVEAAAKEMRHHNVGSLMIVDETGNLVGIVSERDVVARCVVDASAADQVRVGDIMTANVASCSS